MGSSRERGFSVTPEKLAFIEQKMQEMGIETREALAESAGLSIDVIKKLFARKNVDRATIEAITRKALKIEPTEIIETERWYRQSKGVQSQASTDIDWQQVCRGMLPIELDANSLISGDGVTLGIEDIVPLDLVEQKERPKPTRDRSPENFQQVPEDQEIPLPYNQFFDHVLTGCRSLNQQGKGIAIIGEPGAGKTTLLCAIADWIIKRDELPIFVSLQDLEAGLESYLLEVWLKKAIRKREASVPLQDDLIEHCNAGRVWLLLDGIDEMAQAQQSLSNLAKEFRGWVGDARIVLTCRVNVWDANRNELRSKFGVYRSRGFRDEDQLVFIKNFFAKANQPETGSKLIEKLTSAPARLKDLIKSPLWITLLCRTWKRKEGKLPATKAELYQGFTKTFYDWKDKPYVPEEKRPLLERALGELAKKAIDQQDFRFRLRESFIRQELNQFDSSFFRIACELGWINKLGKAVEKPDEAVYAFLHPTFQEYFAALAIDDWHFFLNHTPHSPKQGKYFVFESSWQEVILVWLGRPYIQVSKEQKNAFIKALINFDDFCKDLYGYQAYFLAAICIADFIDCDYAGEIIKKIVEWAFGYFNSERKTWETHSILSKKAIALIRETNATKSKIELLSLLAFLKNEAIRTAISRSNGIGFDELLAARVSLTILEIDSSNSKALNTITEIVNNDSLIFQHLKGIRNSELVASVKKHISFMSEEDQTNNIEELNKNSLIRSEEILDLFELLANIQDGDPSEYEVLASLDKSILRNPYALSPLIEIIESALNPDHIVDKYILFKAVGYISQVRVTSSKAADTLMHLLLSDIDFGNYATRDIALSSLISVSFGNQAVLTFLIELVHGRRDWAMRVSSSRKLATRSQGVNGLGMISNKSFFGLVVSNLKDYLQDKPYGADVMFQASCYATLFHCAQNMTYLDFFDAWNSPASSS